MDKINNNTIIKLGEKPFVGFQGEGMYQGKSSLFIRFAGCNLRCSICDTSYSFEPNYTITYKELSNMLVENYKQNNAQYWNVVFTGGEPLLPSHQQIVYKIMKKFLGIYEFEIETNGTMLLITDENMDWKSVLVDSDLSRNIVFNISPKGNIKQDRDVSNIEPLLISQLYGMYYNYSKYIVKPLFRGMDDLEYIDEKLVDKYRVPTNLIYVQPIGITKEDIIKTVKDNYDEIIKRGYNISMRLHVLLFDNKRGV